MKIQIDRSRCDGHGLCQALLPGAIEVDEWGFPILRDANVPAGGEPAARRAAAACPALALCVTNR